MDLQVLASLQNKSGSLVQKRQATAADLTRDGLACLLEAQAGGFQDNELLAEACELLLDAIRHNRSDPAPFIGMGYLLWLVGEYGESKPYLNEALTLDPDNADAKKLLGLMQPAARPAQPMRIEAAEDPFDLLYDQLESQIRQEVQRLTSLRPDSFMVSSEPSRVEKMGRQYAGLCKTQQGFQKQLEQIEAEIDCSSLRAMLRPHDLFLMRCQDILARSRHLIQLRERLEGHRHWIDAQLEQINRLGSLPADFSAERFDYLLNDCDDVADQLDRLEQSGQDLGSLLAVYEDLVQQVAQLQDLLDQL